MVILPKNNKHGRVRLSKDLEKLGETEMQFSQILENVEHWEWMISNY